VIENQKRRNLLGKLEVNEMDFNEVDAISGSHGGE
jgi:hypothetical protein